MKIILRIIIILVAAVLVAGAFNLVVSSRSQTSVPNSANDRHPLTRTGVDVENTGRRLGHSEGREAGGASIGEGLFQLLISIVKLTSVTAVVLFVVKGVNQLGTKRSASSA